MRTCTSLGQRKGVRIPVFATSAVTGAGLDLLHDFLRRIEPASVPRTAAQTPQGGTPRVAADSEDSVIRDPSQQSSKAVAPDDEAALELEIPSGLVSTRQAPDVADGLGDQEDVPVLFQVSALYLI
jgi:hypothetical protein